MHEASGQLAFDGLEHGLYPDQTKELKRLVAEDRARYEKDRKQKLRLVIGESAVQSAEANADSVEVEVWTEEAV